ncbi:MAG TPA: serine/threonine-protein kinase, partial [Kofleriaceae bacterium]
TVAGLAPPLTAPPSLPPARYQLGPEIARGGMGRVVDALDTRLGRTVAFKEALSADRDALQRFEREIRITARLEHPSIVPVHDAGESGNGAPFYVMRKVSGRPLEKLVASAETLGQRLALIPHIVDSAQAIAHAHERGIVHRDIKPSNILVGELGETVVIDWGLAKVIGEPEPDAHVARPLVDLSDTLKTRAGIVYGTPGFMAPEQLCGAPVDERCDVYALGATLYHLLARTPPHHAKTADEMMKAAVAAPPTPIRELVPGVPLDLSTIVDKALAHDPQIRYQNARTLAEDLQRFLTGQLVASHHYTPREKLIRFVRKNRGVSAAVAALLVVGTGLMIKIYVERNRAQRAEAIAEAHRAEAERRAEELTLTQARYNVDVNPTRAVLMVKPLAAKYWREVRAIAAAAHAAGVAWSLPAAQETLSLEIGHDGTRAVSGGQDGVVRIHDLLRRTTRPVLDLRAPAMARLGDGDRRIVAWHDRQLVIADAATGQRRDVTAQRPIADLEVVAT